MYNLQSNFNRLVDDAISLNVELRENLDDTITKALSPIGFATEFGTVRINCGRRIGKTQYMLSKATSDDLIIVANTRMRDLITSKATIITQDECIKQSDVKFNIIFIDEPTLLSEKAIHAAYKNFATYTNTFVLLG